jgi:hypothetical protein
MKQDKSIITLNFQQLCRLPKWQLQEMFVDRIDTVVEQAEQEGIYKQDIAFLIFCTLPMNSTEIDAYSAIIDQIAEYTWAWGLNFTIASYSVGKKFVEGKKYRPLTDLFYRG